MLSMLQQADTIFAEDRLKALAIVFTENRKALALRGTLILNQLTLLGQDIRSGALKDNEAIEDIRKEHKEVDYFINQAQKQLEEFRKRCKEPG